MVFLLDVLGEHVARPVLVSGGASSLYDVTLCKFILSFYIISSFTYIATCFKSQSHLYRKDHQEQWKSKLKGKLSTPCIKYAVVRSLEQELPSPIMAVSCIFQLSPFKCQLGAFQTIGRQFHLHCSETKSCSSTFMVKFITSRETPSLFSLFRGTGHAQLSEPRPARWH